MCHVHPEILTSYLDGSLMQAITADIEAEMRDDLAALAPEEAAVLAMLRARLGAART
jgi:DNA topoisomerase-1